MTVERKKLLVDAAGWLVLVALIGGLILAAGNEPVREWGGIYVVLLLAAIVAVWAAVAAVKARIR